MYTLDSTSMKATLTLKMFQKQFVYIPDPITMTNYLTLTVPGRDPSGSERLQGVSAAQQLLLFHLFQDVLAEDTGEAEFAVAHQCEHEVHQLFQDVIRKLNQA